MLSPERDLQSRTSRAGLLHGLGDEPLGFEEACARVLAASDVLMAGEAEEEDPRDLTFALGALLYGLTAGAPALRRAPLFLAHERAVKRALADLCLDEDATGLLRQLLAWDPGRRPWPDTALERIRAFAPPSPPEPVVVEAAHESEDEAPALEEDAPTELAAEDAHGAPPGEDAGIEPVQVSTDRFTLADDQEILFLPDGPSRPSVDLQSPVTLDDPSDADDPFSIPDHTRVVPHRSAWQIGLGPWTDDEVTDPEQRVRLSEDDHTDPGEGGDHATPMSLDDLPAEPEGLPVETGPAPLIPMPAPQGVRLDAAVAAPAPARMTPGVRPPRARLPTWLAAGLLLAAIAVGAAIAVALHL